MQSIHLARLATLGVALAFAGPLAAQSTTPNATSPAAAHKGPGHHHGRHALAGLKLTDAQKTRVKAIHEKYRTQLSASRTAAKPDLDAARAARTRGDTAAARAAFARARETMKASQPIRDREMAEIRNELTPEQRQTLDTRKAAWKAGHKDGQRHGHRDKAAPSGAA